MIGRCRNPTDKAYRNYGARGITVCQKWIDSFFAFLADVGSRPSGSHSIDRIDNNGNYEPGNCRWATFKQQQRNRSDNRLLTAFGKTMCVADWADESGLTAGLINCRLRYGWSHEEAVSKRPQVNGSWQREKCRLPDRSALKHVSKEQILSIFSAFGRWDLVQKELSCTPHSLRTRRRQLGIPVRGWESKSAG